MNAVSDRIAARVRTDFHPPLVRQALQELATTETGNQDAERVQAAVVLSANGDLRRLQGLVRLSHVDWRDVLMGSGLEHGDWRVVLEREFGPVGGAGG
ncbi:hypothetical protein ACWEIJ_28265 [Lentzea sp. NPDC004789]